MRLSFSFKSLLHLKLTFYQNPRNCFTKLLNDQRAISSTRHGSILVSNIQIRNLALLCSCYTLLLRNMKGQIDNSVGITPFIIVPRDQLNKVRVEGDTSLSIEDGASGVSDEVLADNFFVSVSQDSLFKNLNTL